jgi:hypothetical protein
VITNAGPEWTNGLSGLAPGAHVAVFADEQPDLVGLAGRLAGLELRDSLVVFRPGPSLSLVLLFRKPLAETSLAEQVWATGTGALNLGACRVPTAETVTTHSRGYTMAHPATRDKHVEPGRKRQDLVEPNERHGRWPPNVLLVHGPECRNVGTKQVQNLSGGVSGREPSKPAANAYGEYGRVEFTSYGENGLETVVAWECEDGCPVAILDEQSGERFVSGTARGRTLHHNTSMGYHGGGAGAACYLPCDDGGASRFYPQFRNETELRAWVERLIGH